MQNLSERHFVSHKAAVRLISGKMVLLVLLLLPLTASAHVGSPDFYYDGYAGPYHVLVTVRPPMVVPGIAEIEIRGVSGQLSRVEIVPMRLVGQGAKLAPTPDRAERSAGDPQLFVGKLWIMSRGSWKVQINAEGPQGKGEVEVPFAAVSTGSLARRALVIATVTAVMLVGAVVFGNFWWKADARHTARLDYKLPHL